MSLRARLFLFFGTFIAVLVLAQWWWVQSLTHDLSEESEHLAMFVGASVAQMLTVDLDCEQGEECIQTVMMTTDPVAGNLDAGLSPADEELAHEIIYWHDGNSAQELQELLRTEGFDPKNGRHVVQLKTKNGSPAQVDHVVADRIIRRVVTGSDSEHTPDQDQPGSNSRQHGPDENFPLHEGHDIRLRVGQSSGSRTLVVERSDRIDKVPIPSPGKEALERFQKRLWLGSAILMALGLLLAAFLAHRVSAPLRRLAVAATDVGDGALGTQVDDRSADREIRSTLHAFNRMSERLAELDAETRRLETLRHMGELGDVARGLAHTMRNPLNALGLSVEELAARRSAENSTQDDSASGLVESARRQIRRIDRGIRSFLLLAGQGSDSDGVVAKEVDIAELVEDVALEALQDVAGRVRLETQIAEGLHACRQAVEPELRAVAQALVVNALEASPDGETVIVRLEPSSTKDERIVMQVDDQGPGLPKAIRERLFTPHLSSKPNGSGMGLFLAHRIAVHRYGGRLELLDRDGGGLRAELEIGPRRASENFKETS